MNPVKSRISRTRAANESPARGLWYLSAWRASRGWTQEQVAEKVGTTKATISKLESGDRDMSEDWIKSYAKAFDVAPSDLMRHPMGSHQQTVIAAPEAIESVSPEEVRLAIALLARRTGMSDNGAQEVAELILEEMLDRGSPVLDRRTEELRVAFDRIVRRFLPKPGD